jgi:uncharacterized protein
MKRSTLLIALLAAMLLATGCATKPPWPAITEPATGVSTPGRWVWEELFTDDVAAAKTFYGRVFDWQFEQVGEGKDAYTVVKSSDRSIAGILHYPKAAEADRSARWLGLMSVPDVKMAAEQASAAGGEIVMAPRRFEGRGEIALLADPEKAFFGIIRSDSGDPVDAFPSFNSWMWVELWAKDPHQMAEFYREIGGYMVKPQDSGSDRTEFYLVVNDYPRAGIIEFQRQDLPSAWLPYIRIKDLEKTLDLVRKDGGQVIIEPDPNIRNGKVAIFIDPQGAAVGLEEWPEDGIREKP